MLADQSPQRGILGTDDCGNWSQPDVNPNQPIPRRSHLRSSRLVMILVVVESTNTTWCQHHYYQDYQRLYSLQLGSPTALKHNRNQRWFPQWSPQCGAQSQHAGSIISRDVGNCSPLEHAIGTKPSAEHKTHSSPHVEYP